MKQKRNYPLHSAPEVGEEVRFLVPATIPALYELPLSRISGKINLKEYVEEPLLKIFYEKGCKETRICLRGKII